MSAEELLPYEIEHGCTWMCGFCCKGRTEADRCGHPHGICKSCAQADWEETITGLEIECDRLRDLLYRLVIKKDGTARQEAEAMFKEEKKK